MVDILCQIAMQTVLAAIYIFTLYAIIVVLEREQRKWWRRGYWVIGTLAFLFHTLSGFVVVSSFYF